MRSADIVKTGIYAVQEFGEYDPTNPNVRDRAVKVIVVGMPKNGRVAVVDSNDSTGRARIVNTRYIRAPWHEHEQDRRTAAANARVAAIRARDERWARAHAVHEASRILVTAGIELTRYDVPRYGPEGPYADQIAQELADMGFIVEIGDYQYQPDRAEDLWMSGDNRYFTVWSPAGVVAAYVTEGGHVGLTARQIELLFHRGYDKGYEDAEEDHYR